MILVSINHHRYSLLIIGVNNCSIFHALKYDERMDGHHNTNEESNTFVNHSKYCSPLILFIGRLFSLNWIRFDMKPSIVYGPLIFDLGLI